MQILIKDSSRGAEFSLCHRLILHCSIFGIALLLLELLELCRTAILLLVIIDLGLVVDLASSFLVWLDWIWIIGFVRVILAL